MSATAKTEIVEGLPVSTTPLPPFRALDLLPELMELADGNATNDVAMLASVAKKLGGGRMRTLLPQILAGTVVTVTENGKTSPVPLTSPELIDLVFDGRMKAFAPVVAFALEASFADFFAGLALAVKRVQTPSP